MSNNHQLSLLQPYPFEKLRAALADQVHGGDLAHIALSIGEPTVSYTHLTLPTRAQV